MTKKKMARISELTAISRTRELTQGEQEERQRLRAEYLSDIRKNMRAALDNIELS